MASDIAMVEDGDPVTAELENEQSRKINEIQSVLGPNPAGSYSDVGASIAAKVDTADLGDLTFDAETTLRSTRVDFRVTSPPRTRTSRPPWPPFDAMPTGGSANLIEEVILSSAAASVTFSDIPDNYRNLRIEYVAKSNNDSTSGAFDMRFNSDSTASHYSSINTWHTLNPTTNGQTGDKTGNRIIAAGACPGSASNVPSGHSGQGWIWIPRYAQTTSFYRHCQGLMGQHGATAYESEVIMSQFIGTWFSTDPIGSMTLFPQVGSFVSGCRFELYGEA